MGMMQVMHICFFWSEGRPHDMGLPLQRVRDRLVAANMGLKMHEYTPARLASLGIPVIQYNASGCDTERLNEER